MNEPDSLTIALAIIILACLGAVWFVVSDLRAQLGTLLDQLSPMPLDDTWDRQFEGLTAYPEQPDSPP